VVGNHGFWGASKFPPQLQAHVSLTAAPAVHAARIRNIAQVFAGPQTFSDWKRGVAGCELNPRVEAEPPRFHLRIL
jgi:hypothetical protein